MRAMASKTAAAVIALTVLVCVVAVAGNGPLRAPPEPYTPSRGDLAEEIGATTADFPVAGALPPEVFPPEVWADGPPGPPAWLLWAVGAIIVTVPVVLGLRWMRGPLSWRMAWPWWRLERWRRRKPAVSSDEPKVEPEQPEAEDDAQAARQAVDAALASLREPAEPRAAVIEAYARMEQVLAERQLGRQTPEAPREYLRRILREQGMPQESLTTLTALFEEARFSRRQIPESAPRRAASELQSARVALAERSVEQRA